MQLHQSDSHHHEIGHHVVAAEEGEQRLHEVGELARAAGDDLLVHCFRLQAPLPGVLEGGDLRGGFLAALFLEEHVVGGVGVEGRVQVDQVNARPRHLAAQDVKIIAKVESVFPVHYERAYHKST